MNAERAARATPKPSSDPRGLLLRLRELLTEIRRLSRRSNPEDLAQIDDCAKEGLRTLDQLEP